MMGRRKDEITLSPKHGLNPFVEQCYCCGDDFAVGLAGRLPEDAKAPRRMCSGEFCDQCKTLMKEGVFFVQVRDQEEPGENPYRTGPILCIRDEAVKQLVPNVPTLEAMLKVRMCFITETVWEQLGLQRAVELCKVTTDGRA